MGCRKSKSATIRPPDSVGLGPFRPVGASYWESLRPRASPIVAAAAWFIGLARWAARLSVVRLAHPEAEPSHMPSRRRSIHRRLNPALQRHRCSYSRAWSEPSDGWHQARSTTRRALGERHRARHTRRRGPGCDVARRARHATAARWTWMWTAEDAKRWSRFGRDLRRASCQTWSRNITAWPGLQQSR